MAHPRLHSSAGKLAGRDPLKKFFRLVAVSKLKNTACGHRIDDERHTLQVRLVTTSWYTSVPAVQVDQQRLALLQGAE